MNTDRWFAFVATLLSSMATAGLFVPQAPPAQPAQRGPRPQPRILVDEFGDRLPVGARLRLGSTRFLPPDSVADIALSPDESTVVTIGRQFIAWDTTTGRERWRAHAEFEYRGPAYGTRGLVFAPDGSRIFVPADNNRITIFETRTGRKEVLQIERPGNQEPFRSIDIRPDGERFAAGGARGLVVCDRQGVISFTIDNKKPAEPNFAGNDRLGFFGSYAMGQFSPDGRLLAVVTSDSPKEIALYDGETGQVVRAIPLTEKLVRLAFSPDGKRIVATERDSGVRLYDVESGKPLWSQVVQLNDVSENYTSAIAFSPDGTTIAVGATDYRIYLFDAATGAEAGRLDGHVWYPWAVAFTGDSRTLYSSGWDTAIRRWDVREKKQLPLPAGIRGSSVATASPDGKFVAWCDDSGTLHLNLLENGKEQRTLELPGTKYSYAAFSADGSVLVGGGTFDTEVHVAAWEVDSGELLRRWEWPKGRSRHARVDALSITRDGTRVAAAVFRQSAAHVLDLTTGLRFEPLVHDQIYGLSFSPDGKTLATAGWDSKVRLWDMESLETRREIDVGEKFNGKDVRMYGIRYAPDGESFATAHMDGTVKIWRDEALVQKDFDTGHGFIYGTLAYSPDGLWLATAGSTGDVTLWEATTGKKVLEVGRHASYVHMVGFGRNAWTLVTGGSDKVGHVWYMRPEDGRSREGPAVLWEALAADDPARAYRVMCGLAANPAESAAFFAQKLRPVRTLIDPDSVPEGTTPEEAERLKRLKNLLAEKEDKIELLVVYRRALAVLELLDEPEARQTLQHLVTQDPDGEVGRLAAAALERSKR